MSAKGYLAKAAYKREEGTNWGTPVSVSTLLPLTSEGLGKNKEFIKDNYLHGFASYEVMDITKISASGSLSLEAVYTGLEEVFLCTFGHEQWGSVVDLGNGFYVHTIEPDDDLETRSWRTNEGITTTTGIKTSDKKVRRFTLVIDKQISQHEFISCFINQMTIQGSTGDVVKVDLDLLSYDRKLKSIDSSTWTYRDGEFKRVLFSDLDFRINGTPVNISEFSLSVNNNLAQTQSNDVYLDEPARSGKREVGLSFKIPRYYSDDIIALYENDSEVSANLKFTHTEGYEIEIILPKCKFNKSGDNVSGTDLISLNFELIPLATNTQKEIQIKLTNKINTELWRI